ncbi:intermembrane lipid transfer protein VPS13B [Culicoides brevitarsis]|uniref:intermembrane lipid transfer protein VPS13B n=1 Tax=Culicoides brevitarsis TaxID=469753 RepID=UPI00307CC2FC
MFRIESYITPIIINYVEKYVKNFRPQDAQVSIFSGDVAFQNLDLRLSALEEDLDLPLKFISGHVHELSIHIPWVKLASEPIVVAINTIEFVVQLRDANDLPTKTSVKEQITPVTEPPPGYLASLVKKIVNNISIKCNNIILKYVEEEIVLSCNIQELTLSSADMNWQPAFIDISPIKFLVRKLVKVNDLTVCLDKRNAMGKIEVCLEPILYRCSLEGRIVTKYNFSTREKTSLNRIDILIKFLDINVSTDQFPMLRRLVELLSILPEKKNDLDMAIKRASTESQEQIQLSDEQDESLVSWLWNQIPAIFPPDDDESTQESSDADDEEHIIHFGTYIETIKVMFKSQEIFNESSVAPIKKVKFTPLMSFEFNGAFMESIRIGKNWQNTQAGISSMRCAFMGDCPCKNSTTIDEPFYSTGISDAINFLRGSLFDVESPENVGSQCKYTANFTSHMEQHSESRLLERTAAVSIDIVDFVSDIPSQNENFAMGNAFDITTASKKHIIRAFIGPFTLKYCPDLVHRTKLLQQFLENYKYSPYLEPKPPLSRNSLRPPTDEEVETFEKKGFPMQIISISVINPSFHVHMWDHTRNLRKTKARGYEKLLLPYLLLKIDRLNGTIQYPLESNLVPTLSQLDSINKILADSPFRRTNIEFSSISGALIFVEQVFEVFEIENFTIKMRELLLPELWTNPDVIKMNVDAILKPLKFKTNAAQLFLLQNLVDSVTNMRYIDVLNTSLLADISNQHLVTLNFDFDLLVAGYDRTEFYQILQLQVEKCIGHAEIPALALKTHVIQWPLIPKSVSSNFISLILQLPLDEKSISHPPIVDLRIEPGGVSFDSLFCRFLNYDVKRWSHPMFEQAANVSSKSDTAVVLDTPIRRKVSVEAKKPLQAIPSVHSSSDRDAGVSIVVEAAEEETKEKEKTNIFEMLKRIVIQIEVAMTTVYFPTKCMTTSIFEQQDLTKDGNLKDNDVAIFRLPCLTIVSSVGQIPIKTETLPISIPSKCWSHGKLSFPWNIQFKDCAVSTIQNGRHFPFLHPNTTNVIININDQGPLSVDLHIDMKPIDVNFIVDQMNFIMRNIRQFLDLSLIKRLYVTSQPAKPTLDFSTNSNSQVSTEIKEFLSYAQTSWFSSIKSIDSKSEIRSEATTTATSSASKAPPPIIPQGSYSLLVQFTLTKVSLVAFNCDPTTKCNKKFTVSLEDIIISFNQRPNYHQLMLKIASAKGECHEKTEFHNEYNKNENLGFHFHSDSDLIHEKGARDAAVLQLLVTCADKIDVQTKWKVKIKQNLNSESRFLTEVGLKMQHFDVALDLELLAEFIGAFRLDERRAERDLSQKNITSVDDLPLFDFQSKGIRVFLPVSRSETKDCNVYILTIADIRMVEPENKINRTALRPDIYHKAQQLGILDVYGTKVENRQYELMFQNISLCTGNWINVLDTFYKQQTATHHDNPALEWNQNEAPPSSKPEIVVKTVFNGFNLGIVYAPSIIFENVLVCQEAIEFNCTKDMTLSMTLNQLSLACQLAQLQEQLLSVLYPKPKPDVLVLNELTQEYVGVSSNLFQNPPTPTIFKRTGSVDFTPASPKDVFREESAKKSTSARHRMPKRTQSLIQIEKRSLQDSGIESLGASNDKKRLKQKISQLKKNYQIKEIVLMPYETYFNGGIFTFRLYKSDEDLPAAKKETIPLLTTTLDRPNIFVRQTNYEKSVKISLLDLRITLGLEAGTKKKPSQSISLLETRSGETDHTGAFLPFFEFRHVTSLTKADEVHVKVGRPLKVKISHLTLEKLLDLQFTVQNSLEKGVQQRKKVIPVPAKRTNAFKQVKNYLQDLNKLNFQVSQVLFELSDNKNYDFKLTCGGVQANLSLVERIERINFNAKVHSLILTANGETILHPLTLEAELSVSQESWKREPIVVLVVKSNFLQVDLHCHHQNEFILMQNALNRVFVRYEEMREEVQKSIFEEEIEKESKVEFIPLQLSLPEPKSRPKQENYEDDLRAGAFQFIETTSLAELPLPYQIQIYSKLDLSSVCWRYPQPRCLSQVKLFPVPIQFAKPTVLECKLEYYNSVRESFMLARSFVLSDQEATNVEIPARNVCSSIWRVTVVQIVVRNEDDSENEEEEDEEETSDSMKDVKADCNITDILSPSTPFNNSLNTPASTFSPKLFVGCLRVDSYYNPATIPTADVIIDFGNIQLNLMACSTSGRTPKIVRGLKLQGGLIPPHKCLSFNLSAFLCHTSVFDDFQILHFDAETEVACDIIDYSFMNYTALLENFKVRAYIEFTEEEKKVNFVTSTMHLRYGQSVAHAISVLTRIFKDSEQILTKDETDLVLMSRYVVCNQTNVDLEFGQFGTSQIFSLPGRSFLLYSLHMEAKNDDNLIFIRFKNENVLKPLKIDEEGVHKCLIRNKILIVNIQNISSFQKKINISGHVEFYNMTSNPFLVQYKIYANQVDTTQNSTITELTVDDKSHASTFGPCIDENAQESIRIKFASLPKKSWSGEIPLKEIGKNNKPWMVKVPAANNFGEASFWVRIIREPIEEFRVSKSFCPERVLVIIWPLYSLKSNLTIHTTAYEDKHKQNYSIFGRGEVKEMQMPGTYEDDHELAFKMDFKSLYDEDKRRALLSYKLIDAKQFFQVPPTFKNIENAIKLLQTETSANWPCKREEELRWNRENSFQEGTLPIYKCGPAQELSCSLMLTISPWALFINSTGVSIRLKSVDGKESCLIEPNNVVMPFSVEYAFEFEIKLSDDEWTYGGLLHINNNFKLGPDSYLIPEEGIVPICVRNNRNLLSNFILHSLNEDSSMRVFILTAGHVVVNYTEHDLNFFSFAIQTNEKGNSLKFWENIKESVYSTDRTSCQAFNAKGTPVTLFSCIGSPKTKFKINSTYNYFLTLFNGDAENCSCPLLLNRKIKRKSFSVFCEGRYIPFIASIHRFQDQHYISIYQDEAPMLAVENLTDFHVFVAQSETVGNNGNAPVNDCDADDKFKWYQQVPSKQIVYYTPPIVDETFPEIDPVEYGLIFSCVSNSGTPLRWSRAVKIDENKEVFLEIPLYGDIKVSLNTTGKTIKVVLDYIRQDTEFSAKDIRARLSNPRASSLSARSDQKLSPPILPRHSFDSTDDNEMQKSFLDSLTIHSFIEGIHITLFNNSDKKSNRKREILLFNLDDVTFRISYPTRQIHLTFDNFQADNQLFTNGDFDFPVIVCSQGDFTSRGKRASVYELEQWMKNRSDLTIFGDIRMELYENDEEGVKSVEIRIKPLRAYIEDSYIMELVDYISDCFGTNALYDVEPYVEKEKCPKDRVLVPREVQQTALADVKTVRLKIIRVHPLNVLLSVHTCLRMYIALDHSPLDFSMYELADVNTLPENLSASASMHYLSGAIFGAGWVVGSLEILGSPSGLVRTFSSGLRDFISMPVQGLFNGPWGFLVGITQGSTSLLRNITAGTVNSVTKLAASLARNLDRLTLDSEHVQRTDAIRRSRPQGVTAGFTQGLTGLGISLLGALGGLAHHPLQANSPVQVVTGFGKGLVGAVAKPISGAAELVALTGQGVLQSVGFNNLPVPRALQEIHQKSSEAMTSTFLWRALDESSLFSCSATMRSRNGFKSVQIVLLKNEIVVFDNAQLSKTFTYKLNEIRVAMQKEDATLVLVTKEQETAEPEFHDEYHVSPRTIQYVQQTQSLSNIPIIWQNEEREENDVAEVVEKVEKLDLEENDAVLNVGFYMDESHARHFVAYVGLLKRFVLSSNEFSPYE